MAKLETWPSLLKKKSQPSSTHKILILRNWDIGCIYYLLIWSLFKELLKTILLKGGFIGLLAFEFDKQFSFCHELKKV
jgi:hypothetical protein